MADLKIRNVPDDLAQALRERAARNARSRESELRAILAEAMAAEGPAAKKCEPAA